MPIVVEIDINTGERVSKEVPLTPEQIEAAEAERVKQAEFQAKRDAREAALEDRPGTTPITRAEFEALKEALRDILL